MSISDSEYEKLHVAVINAEGQYSLWRADAPIPAGWSVASDPCTRDECLDYIQALWVDMAPRSLRHRLSTAGAAAADLTAPVVNPPSS